MCGLFGGVAIRQTARRPHDPPTSASPGNLPPRPRSKRTARRRSPSLGCCGPPPASPLPSASTQCTRIRYADVAVAGRPGYRDEHILWPLSISRPCCGLRLRPESVGPSRLGPRAGARIGRSGSDGVGVTDASRPGPPGYVGVPDPGQSGDIPPDAPAHPSIDAEFSRQPDCAVVAIFRSEQARSRPWFWKDWIDLKRSGKFPVVIPATP
jgi:hypothetical protein